MLFPDMAFAIMRSKKLTGMGSVAASLKHCYRERDTPNADPERTPQNEHRAARSGDQAMGELRSALPHKRRKDAVLAVEYVMTASPEWWGKASPDQQRKFFDQAQKWLADKYGQKNILVASIHRDETTPHLSAFVVPITADGRLSAKEFIGNRDKMNRDQTSFADRMKNLGLERGIEHSKARHQTIQQHYTDLNRARELYGPSVNVGDLEPYSYKARNLKERSAPAYETPQDIAHRINQRISEKSAQSAAALAARGEELERQNKELQRQNVQLQADRNSWRDIVLRIGREPIERVREFVDSLRKIERERQEKRLELERKREKVHNRDRDLSR